MTRIRRLTSLVLLVLVLQLLLSAATLAASPPESTLTQAEKDMVRTAINVLKLTGDEDGLPAKHADADGAKGFRKADLPGNDVAKARLNGGRICYDTGYLTARAAAWPAGDASFPTPVGALARLPKDQFKSLVGFAETTLHEAVHTQQTTAQNNAAMVLWDKCEHERTECAAYSAEIQWKMELRAQIAAMPDSEAAARDAALAALDELIKEAVDNAEAASYEYKKADGTKAFKSIWGTGPWADPSQEPSRPAEIWGPSTEPTSTKTARVKTWTEGLANQVTAAGAAVPPPVAKVEGMVMPGLGGMITLGGGLVTVQASPFSFLEPTEVSIGQWYTDEFGPAGMITHLYEITPHGIYFEPSSPVVLTFRVPDGYNLDTVQVYALDEVAPLPNVDDRWLPVAGRTVDVVDRTVSVPLEHFGMYTLVGEQQQVHAVPSSASWSLGLTMFAGFVLLAGLSRARTQDRTA